MEQLNRIGPIERLQIQRERLIIGTRPDQVYRPDPLIAVDSMVLSPDGPLAKVDGGWVVAVHHAAHPANPVPNLDRMLSVGFTSHYAAMAAHFGSAPIGIAGENIIVAADRMITAPELAGGLVVERPDGAQLELKGATVAEPCVPFTRFMLNDLEADLDLVQPNREFLRNGMRGFVMGTARLFESVEISVGDVVYSRPS